MLTGYLPAGGIQEVLELAMVVRDQVGIKSVGAADLPGLLTQRALSLN